jgi:hypothetical protein
MQLMEKKIKMKMNRKQNDIFLERQKAKKHGE